CAREGGSVALGSNRFDVW
nr:immunoglobulin heavy chain junction region [Macaca mulatta]MOX91826.1 immunoglobulin heavy chain junction region [Macaca mulatta]MOX91839.1 immunoglobulin heavy chain junction region [Macaca mulatta]MOX91971.1 immunoglobulin heavy chain junction region [Macaca mulatta]MOX91972.1 immunoglobulin heavy chain junction region [Macaca mulatta]